jgi:hypothetical protein
MKGRVLYVDGREEFIEPKNGTDFSLEELNNIVGGYIEILPLGDDRIMVVNEEGKLNRLPVNMKATYIVNGIGYKDTIVGNVLVCHSSMVK